MMRRYDYVLFDADHTLYDFDRAERRALEQTLTEHGYPFNAETEGLYRSINNALWNRLNRGEIRQDWLLVERFAAFCRALGRQDDPEALNRDYLDHLAQGGDLLPGAEELCRALAPHYTLALVTNGVGSAQRGRFARSPLHTLIPWLFISGEIGYAKPHPAFFQAVLDKLGVSDRSRVVMVGDNILTDIGGGKAAGLDTIWYNPWGLDHRDGIDPTWEVSSYGQIRAILLPEGPAAG